MAKTKTPFSHLAEKGFLRVVGFKVRRLDPYTTIVTQESVIGHSFSMVLQVEIVTALKRR